MKKPFKYVICALLSVTLLTGSTGCAKLVSKTQEEVLVSVVDAWYRGPYMQPVMTGKTTTFISHPAAYLVTVEYGGKEFTINDMNTYYRYEDRVGEITTGILETSVYSNDNVWYDIVALQ